MQSNGKQIAVALCIVSDPEFKGPRFELLNMASVPSCALKEDELTPHSTGHYPRGSGSVST